MVCANDQVLWVDPDQCNVLEIFDRIVWNFAVHQRAGGNG